MKNRPTETITGAGAGLAVYGFATQVGLPTLIAGLLAAATVIVPYLVSAVVDILRPHVPGPASDSLLSPNVKTRLDSDLEAAVLGTPGKPGASSKTPYDARLTKPVRKPRK